MSPAKTQDVAGILQYVTGPTMVTQWFVPVVPSQAMTSSALLTSAGHSTLTQTVTMTMPVLCLATSPAVASTS